MLYLARKLRDPCKSPRDCRAFSNRSSSTCGPRLRVVLGKRQEIPDALLLFFLVILYANLLGMFRPSPLHQGETRRVCWRRRDGQSRHELGLGLITFVVMNVAGMRAKASSVLETSLRTHAGMDGPITLLLEVVAFLQDHRPHS